MAFENRKQLKGKVIKIGNKTLTVLASTKKEHPIYKKRINVSKKYHVHDEQNQAKMNDEVIIRECRPKSATKRFTLAKIIENKNKTKKDRKDA